MIRFLDIPMERWDERHHITVRASAFLIAKFLPIMMENDFGIIANTIAVEGLSYGAYFSSAMVGQRSMILSLAGELGNDCKVNAFCFAPGVVDTPLVAENADKFPGFYGMTQKEWIQNFVDNPGYGGLMPVEACAASYIYCLAHANEYHG